MNGLADHIRERLAQQQRPRRYNADQLSQMRAASLARETGYNRALMMDNYKRRRNRFKKHKQHVIFCGYTRGTAPEGPSQPVYLGSDQENNKILKRLSSSGKLVRVSAKRIHFRDGYNIQLARDDAEQRHNQARALENLELSGGMSMSEAVMAARHRSAWMAALSVAKDKNNMYAGDDVEPHTQYEIDLQAAGLAILADYRRVYASAHLQPEIVSHALSFYLGYMARFPLDFSEHDHLDFHVMRYSELMVHRQGKLEGTIEEIDHASDAHIAAIVRIADEVMASPRLANYQHHIINDTNMEEVEQVSFIARSDANPPEHIVDDPNARTFGESSTGHDNLRNPGMLTPAEAQRPNFVSQPSWAPPTDFKHWDEWIRVFFEDLDEVAQIPYYSPRIAVVDLPNNLEHSTKAQAVEIKLRQIERLFSRWRNNVVVFMVLDKIRLAAADGDYGEMCTLAHEVKIMMGVEDADEFDVDEISEEEDGAEDDSDEDDEAGEDSDEEGINFGW